MFIKRKTRAGKVYMYPLLLSCKTLVTYEKKFLSDNCVCCEAVFVGGLPCPYLKIENCVHLWVRFSIQNVILGVSSRKNSKMFPCVAFFFLCFWWNVYRSATFPQNLPYHEQFLVARLHWRIILFANGFLLNIWQCSEYVCLSNLYSDLLLCTTYFITHIQKSGIFRTLFIQVYAEIIKHI